jgi:membrane-associated phospholipid phosphatase
VRYYVAIVVLVTLSRLVQTVHFPSDVIFSIYLSTLLCLMIKIRFQRRGFDIFGRQAGVSRQPLDRPRRPAPAE